MRDAILPELISTQAGPSTLRLVFPKIWTQGQSRAFGIYWSADTNHGTLYPTPTNEELAAFYQSDDYDRYLSGNAQQAQDNSFTILDRIVVKIATFRSRCPGSTG